MDYLTERKIIMEDISRLAMLHYLEERIGELQGNIAKLYMTDFKKGSEYYYMVQYSNTRILELRLLKKELKDNQINIRYDNYCIENGLDRKGTRILV